VHRFQQYSEGSGVRTADSGLWKFIENPRPSVAWTGHPRLHCRWKSAAGGGGIEQIEELQLFLRGQEAGLEGVAG
jgi:hypothetical protein